MTLADKVKRLRAAADLSLEDVAVRSGITKSRVWEIEMGRGENPRLSTIIGLARAFGVSPCALIEGVGRPRMTAKQLAAHVALDDAITEAANGRATG